MRPPASRAASWRSTGAAAPCSTGWRGAASRCTPSSPTTLGNPWGYRRLTTYAGWAVENERGRGGAGGRGFSDSVTITGQIGSPQTTALVEPRAFTRGLMRAAEAEGAELRHGTAVDLARLGRRRRAASCSTTARWSRAMRW